MSGEENMSFYKAGQMLWKVFSPILLLLGIFGNTLTIIVLTNKRSRKSSTSLFLAALALSDLLALLTGLIRQWSKFTFDFDVRVDISAFGCKLHWFVIYVVTQYSSWMLVCLTIERVISSWMPHFRVVFCRVRIAIIAIVAIFAILFALNLHFFYGYGNRETTVSNITVVEKCVPLTQEYYKFVIYQWTWIDLCVFYLVPISVFLVGNSAVIYKVIQSRRKSRREIAPVNTNSINVTATSGSLMVGQASQKGPQRKYPGKISSLTITLILVSSVFIICITPIVVFPIGKPYWKERANPAKLAQLYFWDCFSNLIMYVNHTVNFLLYFLSGSRFRNDVKSLLCRKTAIAAGGNPTTGSQAQASNYA